MSRFIRWLKSWFANRKQNKVEKYWLKELDKMFIDRVFKFQKKYREKATYREQNDITLRTRYPELKENPTNRLKGKWRVTFDRM